jgi:hypothetical protein
MPMPPPKPSTEGTRDRQTTHERDQIVRALQDEGPQHREDLERLVGARYWDRGRFDRALTHAVSDGLAMQFADERYGVT